MRHGSAMGFHYEEEFIADGSIDNRIKGRTVLRINFTNHSSSLITLQGNPCRDLAGSLWSFRNPHSIMEELPGEPCHFIPPLCEGTVGHISHTRRCEVSVLPPVQHYERLFDPEQEDPPTKLAPVLELEWFSQKFRQVEIDCEHMIVDLVEMVWTMSHEEAAVEKALADQIRAENLSHGEESMVGFEEDIELLEDWLEADPEPHELEESCLLIIQEFIHNATVGSGQKRELHNNLLKLQEQIAGAFIHLDHEGDFQDIPGTVTLLSGVIPFIERAAESAKHIMETTAENLIHFRAAVICLRDELARSPR